MFEVPKLPYSYDALEPHISKEVMELHHDKHHAAYVSKLNAALEAVGLESSSIEDIIGDLEKIPEDYRSVVRNNGGGHYNHSLFWLCMNPSGGGKPVGDLLAALEDKYGDFETFKKAFNEKAATLFGSGWVWLQPDLSIVSMPNQDNPLMSGGEAPILGLDVWEHAYYLDYKNVRADYVEAWWNIIDWEYVETRYVPDLNDRKA
jgi:superoxide dismutase, Fe-Mn family